MENDVPQDMVSVLQNWEQYLDVYKKQSKINRNRLFIFLFVMALVIIVTAIFFQDLWKYFINSKFMTVVGILGGILVFYLLHLWHDLYVWKHVLKCPNCGKKWRCDNSNGLKVIQDSIRLGHCIHSNKL